MKQNNTSKKRSGMPRLLILLALALFLIAYLTLPAVSRPINRAAAVLGSANVDAVVEYIRSFGAYAMVFSFFLMVFSSVAAPLPAFLITLSNAAIFGWWQGAILSWSSAMAGAALCFFISRGLGRDMVERYPELHFDFHAHNDYDLAVANVAAAVKAGVQGIHTTVNGLGERAGNAPLSSVIAVLNDHLKVRNTIVEKSINHVSRIVETYTGIHIPANEPVVGENVFTQCAGIHADGDNKDNLYYNDLLPERFGRVREYALGKMSGKANIKKNLDTLGIDLDEEAMRKVTERIIELGDKKQAVTSEDLPYIIADILKQDVYDVKVHILNYNLSLSYGLRPVATVKIRINDRDYEETSSGDGQYDAFMRAIRKIYKEQLKRDFPMLVNYSVSIPPGGRTDAFVQTYITWEYRGETFKTRGLDADQTEAAIKATLKMLNKVENILNQQSSGEN